MFFSSGSTSAVLQTRRHPLWSGCAASGVGIMGIQNLEIGVVDALDHLLMAPVESSLGRATTAQKSDAADEEAPEQGGLLIFALILALRPKIALPKRPQDDAFSPRTFRPRSRLFDPTFWRSTFLTLTQPCDDHQLHHWMIEVQWMTVMSECVRVHIFSTSTGRSAVPP